MRNSFLNFFPALLAVFLSTACAREGRPETDGDYIPVRLSIALPDGQGVKSIVNYGSDAVTSMWLLCFNQVNSCVGCVEAAVSGSSITVASGIPRDTRSIHFIANKDLSAFNPVGVQEQTVLTDPALVSSATDPVAFWGYFHGNTVGEMKNFLDADTPATLYILRDRARLIVGDIDPGIGIREIQWVVTRGLGEGYIAPASPFDNYYKLVGGEYYGNTTANPKGDAVRYAATSGDFVGSANPLYLFEDGNSFKDLGNLVKVILKVTYNDNTVRYHDLVMMDRNYVTTPVVRSNTYKLNISALPKNMGYDSFDEAMAGEVFSNNYFVSIDRDADMVTDGTYSLSIDDPQGTHILYQSGVSKSIQFSYKENGAPEAGRTKDDFYVMWLENDRLTDTEPILTYNDDGTGAIIFSLNPFEDGVMHQGLLILQDTKHGLSRYVEVYAKARFQYEIAPLLQKVTGKTHNAHDVYSLTFTLPDYFPQCFLPINIPFASLTLSPFSDSTPDSASGTFSVTVSSTDDLNESNSVSEPYDWNYKAKDWDFWYNYSFTPSDMSTSGGRTVTIYLEDVRSSRPDLTFRSVGLFLRMPRFGGIINNLDDFDDHLHCDV